MKWSTILVLALISLLCACSDAVVQGSSTSDDSVEDESRSRDTSLQTGDADNTTDLASDTSQSDGEADSDLVVEDVEDGDPDLVAEDLDEGDSSGDLLEGDPDLAADESDIAEDAEIVEADLETGDTNLDQADAAGDTDGPICPLGCFTEEDDVSPGISRPVPLTCNSCRPAVDAGGGFPEGTCGSDADCCDGDNGRCVWGRGGPFCSYDSCFQDSDCASDELCACDGARHGGNACIEAGCHVDSECGDYKCMPSLGGCGHYFPPVGYYCHTPDDECYTDDDCTVGDCRYFETPTPHWACSDSECLG